MYNRITYISSIMKEKKVTRVHVLSIGDVHAHQQLSAYYRTIVSSHSLDTNYNIHLLHP